MALVVHSLIDILEFFAAGRFERVEVTHGNKKAGGERARLALLKAASSSKLPANTDSLARPFSPPRA